MKGALFPFGTDCARESVTFEEAPVAGPEDPRPQGLAEAGACPIRA